MDNFNEILEIFESMQDISTYSPEQLGDHKAAKNYLKKYWLPQEEYEKIWKPLQDKIFINQNEGLPELIFPEYYNLVAIRGGVVFCQHDFELLQKCFLELGDKYFVIIQNPTKQIFEAPLLQVKYPTNITWDKLIYGGSLAAVLFGFSGNEFFVFGQTDAWGKYCANDYIDPLDIIGFKPAYNQLFKSTFKLPAEEWDEIKDWLPPLYKDKINNN